MNLYPKSAGTKSPSANVNKIRLGWHNLLDGYPWFFGKGQYPLPAYSEFMPPPRLGRTPYGAIDLLLFSEDDPYGWHVSEIEEEYEIKPGLENIARQIIELLVKLGEGQPAYHISGHKGMNLLNNPYWPPELVARAGYLTHERYVVLLPLALSRTQDAMGRVRWTYFGSSEQGPERGFWKSFYLAPGQELSEQTSLAFILQLLSSVYGESVKDAAQLFRLGFRILPSEHNLKFPYGDQDPLPAWTQPYLINDRIPVEDVRYLLTFRPFSNLPDQVRERYLLGKLNLLPFPGSLVPWGMPTYLRLQQELPMAMQIALQRWVVRHDGPRGIRVPQSGWLSEPHPSLKASQIQQELLLDTYRRTNRWNRVHRYDDALALNPRLDKVAKVLFSTALDSINLYDKPLARNSQIWTKEFELVLNGPNATPTELLKAETSLVEGGLFGYRFLFPAMRVGLHEVYWHRPLAAYWSPHSKQAELLSDAPLGYLTAYRTDLLDLTQPVELWPRLLRRDLYLSALQNFDHLHDHYAHQTPLNILSLLDSWQLGNKQPLRRSFAHHLLRIAKNETLDEWLNSLPKRTHDSKEGRRIQKELEKIMESPDAAKDLPQPLTYDRTATRSFEESFWRDILTLSHAHFVNKDNADCVQDQITQSKQSHHRRDLEHLGDYLISRHRKSISEASMNGKALCGELPFQWKTDFDFSLFGGWKNNQEGHTYERNILVVIPGKDRTQAVVMADHYDTAYMEDIYDTSRGGSGARLAAAGADDNHSATTTLLLAAPIFLRLAKEGRLERDIWLLHLTGEEFPSDCMGARNFSQALVEKTLRLRLEENQSMDLSQIEVVGLYVLDMIAHNRDKDQNVFQISHGKSRKSLDIAYQAHIANMIWNAKTSEWNETPERRGKGQGQRCKDGHTLPNIALHPCLDGEVRTIDDPASSLFNTDGQIFSDIGVPVVLFMENYDINRTGYHDTHDTMENIDLDYGSAVAAIAIEAVARIATQE
jgi:hypothetical protein